VQLVESSGGTFDVRADGQLIFSKKKMGRHAHAGEIARLLHEGR
jgi:predicted Rdx family selenoprotein